MIRLSLSADDICLSRFYPLLEKGVVLSVRIGCTLRDFLCGQLGLSDDYVDNRIQTLFLNARPVDDVDRAVVQDGATLALSAAMPGLVGATMRKGGRYAALRREISQPAEACGICEAPGRVTLKLFNMVAKEVGGRLLAAGVEVDGSDLGWIAERCSVELKRGIRAMRMNDREIEPDPAIFSSLAHQRVWLSINPAE